jgi:exopolyphosphatase / guanosine-5'-triphosphate,3'-diphosphate pyrophosphatase
MTPGSTLRIGAIDVGTNSVHLVVADIDPDGRIQVVEKQRRQVALGEGGLDGRRLSPAAMRRALRALGAFREACDSLDVQDIHCAATSAVREAENGVDFCKQVKAEIGIHVRIITGLDEARLIYLGARPHLDFSRGRVLLVDLGGGSTEFVLCDAETTQVRASLPLGHLRATALFRRQDPATAAEIDAVRRWTRDALAPLATRVHPGDVGLVVGTSGTMRCLARMATRARGEVPTDTGDGLLLSRDEVEHQLVQFQDLPARKLARLPGMDDKRRDTLPAGAAIVAEVLRFFAQDQLVTSAYSLRDGLLVDWVLRNRPELERSRTEADPRRRSVLRVMERYGIDERHARQVAHLALEMFDATRPAHRLRRSDRQLLEHAALLHDVGHHISGEDHHKHGAYLLRHTRMSGFTAPEVDALALVARYHRGKHPKKRDLERLDRHGRRRLLVLAGLVAVADALDRGRDGNVEHLDVSLEEDVLRLSATTRGPAHLERWAVVQRQSQLERALDVSVEVDIAPGPALSTGADNP